MRPGNSSVTKLASGGFVMWLGSEYHSTLEIRTKGQTTKRFPALGIIPSEVEMGVAGKPKNERLGDPGLRRNLGRGERSQ
jgi:hypothetical protein